MKEPELAHRQLGQAAARKLVQAVNTMLLVDDFNSLVRSGFGQIHRLKGNRRGQWSIKLDNRLRLLVAPDPTFTTVTIIGIVDYH